MEITGNTIKKELRTQGFDTKKISASVKHFGYGDTSITIRIKDLSISLIAIEQFIKQKYQEIRYDEYIQGEILQGCNTYVNCSYDYEVFETAVDNKMNEATELFRQLEKEDTYNGILIKETEDIKVYAFLKSQFISCHSKKNNSDCFYNKHCLFNKRDLAHALVKIDIEGHFGTF